MKVKLCQHILLNTSKSINSYKVFEKGFFKKSAIQEVISRHISSF